VPVWQMISRPADDIKRQAQRLRRRWQAGGLRAQVLAGESPVGGGSVPGGTLPTWLVAVDLPSPDRFAARLRQCDPPVITRIEDNRLVFDPRTLLPGQERVLLAAVQTVQAGIEGE
jgi:L-seryl-tRNA(Ser) seleniumtransferase